MNIQGFKLEHLKSVIDTHGTLAVRETSADHSTTKHKPHKFSAPDVKHSDSGGGN